MSDALTLGDVFWARDAFQEFVIRFGELLRPRLGRGLRFGRRQFFWRAPFSYSLRVWQMVLPTITRPVVFFLRFAFRVKHAMPAGACLGGAPSPTHGSNSTAMIFAYYFWASDALQEFGIRCSQLLCLKFRRAVLWSVHFPVFFLRFSFTLALPADARNR